MKDKNWLAAEEFTRKRTLQHGTRTLNERIALYSKPGAGGCIEWTARVMEDSGRAQMIVDGRRWTVYRLIWIRAHGRIPDKLVVRHKCDNARCINLGHLELGTYADNNRDRKVRGRGAVGIKHHRAQVTEAEVVAIRESPETSKALGARYGLSIPAVQHIRDRYTWGHLPVTPGETEASLRRKRNTRLTEETVRYILDHPDTPLAELARLTSVSKPTVWAVRWRKAWRHIEPTRPGPESC